MAGETDCTRPTAGWIRQGQAKFHGDRTIECHSAEDLDSIHVKTHFLFGVLVEVHNYLKTAGVWRQRTSDSALERAEGKRSK